MIVRGSTVYDAPALFEVYRGELGKPISSDGVRAIAAAIVAKYEGDGYSRPQIKLDDALLSAGVLRLDVLEPRISDVRVSGDPGPHLSRLEQLGSQLEDAGPITQAAVDTTLRRMRALPGLTLSATTARDAATANLYTLDVDADFDRVAGTVRLSNRGTDQAGPNFVLGHVMVNGLFEGDTNLGTTFGAATDYDEYHDFGVVANVGIGNVGGRMSFAGLASRSNPHEPIVDRDDSYLRDRASIGFLRPLPGFERAAMTLTAGLDFDDLEILRSGDRLRDERLRMLTVGSRWSFRQSSAQYFASVDLVQGLDALGAGLTALDIENDPRSVDFTLTRLSFTRLVRIGDHWNYRVDALGQQTSDVLPYGERFKIGGDRLGRGFELGSIAGDQGLGAKVEIRRSLPNAPSVLRSASLYGYYDVGLAWKHDLPGRESATTGAIGFFTQGRRLAGTLELAKPFTHPDVEGSDDLTLFIEIAVPL